MRKSLFDLRVLCLIAFFFACHSALARFMPVNGGMVNNATVVTTAAGTTTAVATSNQVYVFEGTQNQNFVLPDATKLPLDWWYQIVNNSTGTVTVKDAGGSTVKTLLGGEPGRVQMTARANAAGTWKVWPTVAQSNLWFKPDFISSSSGGASAGLPVKTNGSGLLDFTFFGQSLPLTTKGDLLGFSTSAGRFPAGSDGLVLTADSTQPFGLKWTTPGAGTLTGVSVATANGFGGSSSGGATPALTLTTSCNGVCKGDGTAISSAVSGTDYQAPLSSTTPVSHQFLTSFTAPNTFAQAQPAFTDISGTATNSQLANMAAHTFKGNNTGSSAAPLDLTATQLTAEINAMVGDSGAGGTKGLVPAPAAGDAAAGKVLKADGTWGSAGTSSPLTTKGDLYTYSTTNDRLPIGTNGQVLTPNSGVSTGLNWVTTLPTAAFPALTGDVTTSSGSLATTIANNAVTNAKAAQMANGTTKCRTTAGTGNAEDCTGAQETALLSAFVGDSGSGGTKGLVPAPSAGDAAARRVPLASGSWAEQGIGAYAGINFATLDTAANSWKNDKPDNMDAESSVGGWAAYSGATLTGGSPNTTCTRNTSSPINGAGDLLQTVSSGATRAGEGCSLLINIPTAYRGKAIRVTFPYITTGTIAAGDFVITGYDVTNASTLTASTTVSAISGSAGTAYATFITQSSTAQLRLAIDIERTSTGAATVEWDDFKVEPDVTQANVPVSDWRAYTPTFTGFGTVSTQTFFWRRFGDSVEVSGKFTTGTPTNVTAIISLPNSLAIDSSKAVSGNNSVGVFFRNSGGSTATGMGGGVLINPSTSTTGVIFTSDSIFQNAAGNLNWDNSVTGTNFGTGDVVTVRFTVPVSGWSSGGGAGPLYALSDWSTNLSVTPSAGFGTPSSTKYFSRRVGDTQFWQGYFTIGTTAASTASMALPTGYKIDSAKMGSGAQGTKIGTATFLTNSTLNLYSSNLTYDIFYDGSDTSNVYFAQSSSSIAYAKFNVSTLLSANQIVVFNFSVPIAGWTSTSSGTLTAPRATATYDGCGPAGVCHGSSDTKVFRFGTTERSGIGGGADFTVADSATAGTTFTIVTPGMYSVGINFGVSGSTCNMGITVNDSATTTAVQNPLTYAQGLRALAGTQSNSNRSFVGWSGYLKAGDVLRGHDDGTCAYNDTNTMITVSRVSN